MDTVVIMTRNLKFCLQTYTPGGNKKTTTFEPLSFVNHTSCKCQRGDEHNEELALGEELALDEDSDRRILTNRVDLNE